MKKILSLSLIVVLLLLVMAPATYAAPPAWGGDGGGGGNHYCVKYGDTLFSIGRRYGVNPYHIAQVNGLHNPNHIYAGQCLYIPPSSGWGHDGCGYNCYDKPSYQPGGWGRDDWGKDGWGKDGWGYNGCGYDGCGKSYQSGWGYDGAGYYYYNTYPNGYNRYSYPCGYNYNCYSW